MRRSLTWDRGIEMTRHQQFTAEIGVPVYFCNPYSPWQRGTNENTNGLLRQYFPKKTDLRAEAPIPLLESAAQINGRPREHLNWHTANEVYQAALVAMTG